MDEDEKVAALEWALRHEAAGEYEQPDVVAFRALVDAVRLIRAHEWSGQSWCRHCSGHDSCIECRVFVEGAHNSKCEVGSWVRAAAKAGI